MLALNIGGYHGAPDDPIHTDPEIQIYVDVENLRWRFTKTKNGKRGQFIKVNNWPACKEYLVCHCCRHV